MTWKIYNGIKNILDIAEVKNNKIDHINKDTKQIKQKTEENWK